MQDGANPCYIPRNHLLQKAIEAAEKGVYGPVSSDFWLVYCCGAMGIFYRSAYCLWLSVHCAEPAAPMQ